MDRLFFNALERVYDKTILHVGIALNYSGPFCVVFNAIGLFSDSDQLENKNSCYW